MCPATRRPRANTATSLAAALLLLAAPAARAIDIQFDYSYDANGFFTGHPERRASLEAAAQAFESRLTDLLTGITPGGGNTWTADFLNPATGQEVSVTDLTIPKGVILIYVGARNLGGTTLGFGGPGGLAAEGTQQFLDDATIRGQAGASAEPPTDFGPWGGFISFDLDTTWYFDPDVKTMESIGSLADFYSVALHELGHVFGLGTARSWDTDVTGLFFTGAAVQTENGGPALLATDAAHWAEGTTSRVTGPVTLASQEAAMDPTLTTGQRKYFTELDYAALGDVGWQVVPEPSLSVLLALGGVLLASTRRRAA